MTDQFIPNKKRNAAVCGTETYSVTDMCFLLNTMTSSIASKSQRIIDLENDKERLTGYAEELQDRNAELIELHDNVPYTRVLYGALTFLCGGTFGWLVVEALRATGRIR